MARRKQQQRLLKKILLIGGALVGVQVGLIVYFSQSGPAGSIKEEIATQVKGLSGLTPERREKMRVQLAIDDFRASQGRLPKTLSELTPTYFDSIPKDPNTNKPYSYAIEGKKYSLGEGGAPLGKGVVAASSDGGPPTAEEQEVLLASLDSSVDSDPFLYEPTGKRDPFQPVDLSKGGSEQDCKEFPLACFDIGQLRYSTYLQFGDDPRGMVEDITGVGHPVRIGTRIGRNDGEIMEILPDKITVVEKLVDVTGQTSTRAVAMPLSSKMEENRGGGGRGRATGAQQRRR